MSYIRSVRVKQNLHRGSGSSPRYSVRNWPLRNGIFRWRKTFFWLRTSRPRTLAFRYGRSTSTSWMIPMAFMIRFWVSWKPVKIVLSVHNPPQELTSQKAISFSNINQQSMDTTTIIMHTWTAWFPTGFGVRPPRALSVRARRSPPRTFT